jgi:sialic acid synthase SpsE
MTEKETQRTIIIAEIGECYNGDLATAERLMKSARDAGCDIAKFQTLDYEQIAPDDPEKEWFERIALTPARIDDLIARARKVGIEILFTPENVKTAGWLVERGLRDVKIASSSVADAPFVRFVNDHFYRVFISTGMASLDEVRQAVATLHSIPELHIMHCISEYPTGPLLEQRGLKALAHEDVRLNMMRMLMEIFPQHAIGYSDHTAGILAPVAAVAMGASVIEKHITLDRKTPVEAYRTGKTYLGTDHVLSLEPDELAEMVRQIREVETMFGPRTWERSEGERLLRDFLRGRFAEDAAKGPR